MKSHKTIFVISLIILVSLACSEPINLSTWLAPSREALKDIFTLLGAVTPQVEEAGKTEPGAALTPMATELAITATVLPEIAQTPSAAAAAASVDEVAADVPSGRILYTCQVDKTSGHDQICLINADGTGFTQLTDDSALQHLYPSWAPDGLSFVFTGIQDGIARIYEMTLSGDLKVIGDVSGQLYAPMISPDGKKIVFQRSISNDEQYISVMNRDGSALMDLVEYYGAKDPVWSVDGKSILFTAAEEGTTETYVMNSSGVTIQKVAGLSGLAGRPDWSLQGAIVTYSGSRDKHNREIVLMEKDELPVTLTNTGDNLSPSFSPDGEWIAFTSYRDSEWHVDGCEIYLMRKDGTDVRRLTENDYCDYQPRWGK